MFVLLSRLVEVEVTEPEPREGKHHGWAFAPNSRIAVFILSGSSTRAGAVPVPR